MGRLQLIGVLGCLVGLLLAAVSCGGSDDDDRADESAAPSTTTASDNSSTAGAGSAPTAKTPGDQTGDVDQTPPGSANGIIVVGDRLFVASTAGNEILAVDPADGRITARFGTALGVEGPDDVAIAPDGTLWFTALTGGWVGRLDSDGQAERVADLGPGVNPITFSPDGAAIVGRLQAADDLWELDPSGAAEPRLIAEGLGNVNAFQFGPDGALYGPRFGLAGAGAVVRIDVETGQSTVVAEGLDFPTAVRFTDDGDLLVAQINPAQILQVDQATGRLTPVMEVGHAIDNFAVAPDGTLYVTGFDKPVISAREPDGNVRTMDIGRP